MYPLDVRHKALQEAEVEGITKGLFTDFRVEKDKLPEGVHCYELRHGDDDSFPVSLERDVTVNFYGTLLTTKELDLTEKGYIELTFDDFWFTDEMCSIEEYLEMTGEESIC